jgi:hypothetical protein
MVTIFMMNEEIARGMVCFFHQKKHSYLILFYFYKSDFSSACHKCHKRLLRKLSYFTSTTVNYRQLSKKTRALDKLISSFHIDVMSYWKFNETWLVSGAQTISLQANTFSPFFNYIDTAYVAWQALGIFVIMSPPYHYKTLPKKTLVRVA